MDNSKRLWLSALGLIALVGVTLTVVVSGGDDPRPRVATVSDAGGGSASEGDAEEAKPVSNARRIETYEVFASKDPFEPMVAGIPAGDGATVAAGDELEGGVTKTFDTETTGSHTRTVKLVDVYRSNGVKADIEVDDYLFTVAEGEIFAEHFMLLSASDDCATLLYGDDEFTICEGEAVLK